MPLDPNTLVLHPPFADELFDHSISHPIYLSSTYPRNADGTYPHGYSYSRGANPNRRALEDTLCALEKGKDAIAFSSGAAAVSAVFQSLTTGDHVIVPQVCYHGTLTLLREIFSRWGLLWNTVDMTSLDAVRSALTPTTRLIWLETPANPDLAISDIQEIARIAHDAGAMCIADNTVATALLQEPFLFGCDAVVYSTTKYIAGHSDVIGGAVIVRDDDELTSRLRTIQIHGGAVPSPFDCWLTMRGLRTLPLRIQAQCQNALDIAQFLSNHTQVLKVNYPGLDQHPGHELARRQMKSYGGLLSFELKGGKDAALKVLAKIRLIRRATSLGGVESLIEHRASVEGPHSQTSPGLLRLSVGIESVKDLIGDLNQALSEI
jgi:cystathionine gamma-synthase